MLGSTTYRPLTPVAAGVAHRCAAEPGERRVGGGFGPRQPRHQRIIPLMERALRIYEMSDVAEPTALACSRPLHERLPRSMRP
jgi:hypothetical protein